MGYAYWDNLFAFALVLILALLWPRQMTEDESQE